MTRNGYAAVSERGSVPPFQVMRVFASVAARRQAGLPVVDLSAGQPSTPAPGPVRAAAVRAIETAQLGYTSSLGITSLREAIAGHYAARVGVSVDPTSIAVTTGSSGGFLLAFLAAFETGDTVVMARPGYPAYRNMLLHWDVTLSSCGAMPRLDSSRRWSSSMHWVNLLRGW